MQFPAEVLHVLKMAVARPSLLISGLEQQQTTDAQPFALHLIAHARRIGKVHMRIAWVPALRFEIGQPLHRD